MNQSFKPTNATGKPKVTTINVDLLVVAKKKELQSWLTPRENESNNWLNIEAHGEHQWRITGVTNSVNVMVKSRMKIVVEHPRRLRLVSPLSLLNSKQQMKPNES